MKNYSIARGKFIKRKREDLGIKQENLAKELGISPPTLIAIEQGKDLKATLFNAICKKLDITNINKLNLLNLYENE